MSPDALSSTRRDALAIGAAVGVYGVSFGVLAVAAGLSALQAVAMSVLVFTGASQFAFVGVLAAGGTALAALAPSVLLAGRNAVYGVTASSWLGDRPAARALRAHLVIDESVAMGQAREEPGERRYAFMATGLSVLVLWTLGTLVGALVGEGIGDPRDYGLDAVFPAAFLALLWPQLRSSRARAVAVGGIAIALVLVPVAPVGLPLVGATLALVPTAWAVRRKAATAESSP